MRVGLFVDALSPVRTGIGRYCWELTRGLPNDPRVTSVSYLLGDEIVSDPARMLQPAGREPRWRRALTNLRPKKPASASSFEVLHSPNYFIPDWAGCGIATIHDLSVFRYPETHPAERISAFERQFSNTLEKASHLIVDCETIRREVIDYTGFAPDRVTAIALGVDETFQPVAKRGRDPILRKYGLPLDGYGLTLAALEPRKRIDRLISAWSLLPKALLSRFPLVIAGASGWKNERLQRQMACASGEGWLIPLGFVPEQDLAAIYSGAKLFVFPSLYEGFGLPPLEAMATGVPSIVAAQSCLPEVTRGAAMEIDPEDVPAFALAIQNALEDDEWRRNATELGLKVAGSYTWRRCVDETVDLYERCIGVMSDRASQSAMI